MDGMTTIEFNPPEEDKWAQATLDDRGAKPENIVWALAQLLRSIPKDVPFEWNGVNIRRPHIILALEDCSSGMSYLESEVKRLKDGRSLPKVTASGRIKFMGGSY